MIQEVQFAGPSKKQFVKPKSKDEFRDKERKRKRLRKEKKKQANAKDEEMKAFKDAMEEQKDLEAKAEEEEQIAVKNPKSENQNSKEYLQFFLNKQSYMDYFVKPIIKKKKKKDPFKDEPDEEVEEITFTDFLNPTEFQEIKGQYDDLNIGEIVIKFVNPDDESVKDRAVKFKEAEDLFDKMLTVVSRGGISKSVISREKKAFLLAFLSLKDYVEPVVEDVKFIQKKTKKNIKKKKQDSKDKKGQNQQSPEKVWINPEKNREKSDFEKFKEQHKDLDPSKIESAVYIESLLNIDLHNLEKFNEVQKQFSQGGLLYKRYTEDKSDWDWICHDKQPQDFLTLVRYTIITKMARDAHMHVRSILSTDGLFIFVVLKSQLPAVIKYGELMGMYKQYELGYADLFSLEPTDEQFRPLRLKQYIRDPEYQQQLKKIEFDDDKNDAKANLERIENKVQKVYQQAEKWNDGELRAKVAKKQLKLDEEIKKIAAAINYDQAHEKVELLDDKPLEKQMWVGYYVYLSYLEDFVARYNKIAQHPEVKENKGFVLKLIFLKALGDTNETFWNLHGNIIFALFRDDKKVLRSLWDRIGVPPIGPFGQFFSTPGKDFMWRKYQNNEKGQRSEFTNMEKLKHINILKIVQDGYALQYLPLHENFQLKGDSKMPYIKPLISLQMITPDVKTEGQSRLEDLYASLKDEAEPTDFDSESLQDEASFSFLSPWSVPIASIREYYGEKVALYFRFSQFFTKQLFKLSMIAILSQIIIDRATNESRDAFIIIFALIIIIWSSLFTKIWKQQQVVFQIEFGQNNFQKGEAERPAFEGTFMRSMIDDNLNEEFYPTWKYKSKMALSLFISFVIIVCVIACVVGIFQLKQILTEKTSNQFVNSTIPSLINSIQIQIFNVIYFYIANALNSYENHKYASSYENSFIVKNFLFIFVNTFNSLFIIAFLDKTFPALHLCKVDDGTEDCFLFLQTQMISIFLVNFAKLIPSMIVPCIITLIKSGSRKQDDTPVEHEFMEIDAFIEDQTLLQPFQTNIEVDGTVASYLELIIQYSFLTLFGLAFPLSYFIGFLTNVARIQVDKIKLFHFTVRPFPSGASDIGNWLDILEIVNFISVFVNAALITYTSGAIVNNKNQTFIILVLLFLFTSYITKFLIPEVPPIASHVRKRHEGAVDRVYRSLSQSSGGYFV